MKHLSFSYTLPKGSMVKGFDAGKVSFVTAFCTPDEEDGYIVSYHLPGDSFGMESYGGFGGDVLPCQVRSSVEEVEAAVRSRIEQDLLYHEAGTLERRYNRPVFIQTFQPACIGGRSDVKVLAQCYWYGPGIYQAKTWLIRQDGYDIGLISARFLRAENIPLDELHARVQETADALMPDGFEEMVDTMILRDNEEW